MDCRYLQRDQRWPTPARLLRHGRAKDGWSRPVTFDDMDATLNRNRVDAEIF
jgi:hypothetical protein